MIRGLHLVDPGKYDPVADKIMGNIRTIIHGAVFPDIAGNDHAVSDPRGKLKIMTPYGYILKGAQTHQTVETGIPYKAGIKGIAYQKILPAGNMVAVFKEQIQFPVRKRTPGPPGNLPPAEIKFILPGREKFGGYKAAAKTGAIHHGPCSYREYGGRRSRVF
jgi:hypothetical protein